MKIRILSFLFMFFANFIFAENLEEFENEYKEFKVNDPLYSYNKAMTSFNVALYDYGFNPVLKAYNSVTPSLLRVGVRNFFDNLLSPLRFFGNLLQFKFKNANDEFKRFLANSILGFGGVFDPASKMGFQKHYADLGTALAHWGVGSGFHLVLPVFGPSNLRDTLSLPAAWYSNPISYIEPTWASVSISAYGFANELSFRLDELDELYHSNVDLYLFLRDAYEQRRIELSK